MAMEYNYLSEDEETRKTLFQVCLMNNELSIED